MTQYLPIRPLSSVMMNKETLNSQHICLLMGLSQQTRVTDQRESMTTPDQKESVNGRNVTDFNLDGPPDRQDPLPAVIPDEEDCIPQDVSVEFLRWHQRLGHILPKKIKIMAEYGILPKRLATCRVPMCTTCMFGKATRKPWRTKAPQNREQPSHTITKPGGCVSVDQLESSTPGLIGQLQGIPTIKRYEVATVCIDHYSGLGYVHLQKSTTAIEKLWRPMMLLSATLPHKEESHIPIMLTMVALLTISFAKR